MDAQDSMATVHGLAAFRNRGAGSDAERRAADWLAKRCSAAGHDVAVETFWCRPNWAFAHAWHAALAVAGSLIALASPIVGIVLLGISLASVLADAVTGISLGRRLTPERASQNVVVSRRHDSPEPGPAATHLVLTANYDAGRIGLAYRLKPVTARLTAFSHGMAPGWSGWLSLAIIWLLGVAVLRQLGHTSHLIGALQLPPTVGLLLALALLIELASGNWSPAASDNATGVAAALGVARALNGAPPQHVVVDVVLAGAGDGDQIGLRQYLRRRRNEQRQGGRRHGIRRWPTPPRSADAIVVGLAASGAGTPHWWQSDGSLVPLRYSASLRAIAAQVAQGEAYLKARSHRGRGSTPAFPARTMGLPALTIGGLDDRGVVPRSHQASDIATAIDLQALDRMTQFALLLVDGIDAAVGAERRHPAATPA